MVCCVFFLVLGEPLAYNNPLLFAQGKHAQAEPLYEKSRAIQEKVVGQEHPEVATLLNNRAGLLSKCSSALRLTRLDNTSLELLCRVCIL